MTVLCTILKQLKTRFMKSKVVVFALCLSVVIAACNKSKSGNVEVSPVAQGSSVTSGSSQYANKTTEDSLEEGSKFISVGVANEMISSYIYSITNSANANAVKSFTVNADSLRAYLSDPNVKNIKLVLAHTQEYAASSASGTYAGYSSGALTIVIAASDASGNYVYRNGNVLDHCIPCPSSCGIGNAASNLLIQ
jgi:hypothetical protein